MNKNQEWINFMFHTLCIRSATSTCSTHLWRNPSPSLCWVWSSYATSTCTCSAWGTSGSWSSTFQSPHSPPSSSSPANSKTEPMTVGSEEQRTLYCAAPLTAPVFTAGEDENREASGFSCGFLTSWKIIITSFLYTVCTCTLCTFVSKTIKSKQWNAVLSGTLNVSANRYWQKGLKEMSVFVPFSPKKVL